MHEKHIERVLNAIAKCIRTKHLCDLTGERPHLVGLGEHLPEFSLYIKLERHRRQETHMRYHTWLQLVRLKR